MLVVTRLVVTVDEAMEIVQVDTGKFWSVRGASCHPLSFYEQLLDYYSHLLAFFS